jgi:hypothetical protein
MEETNSISMLNPRMLLFRSLAESPIHLLFSMHRSTDLVLSLPFFIFRNILLVGLVD